MNESTQKKSFDTRTQILRKASLLFWRHGYRGTSTRQIAEAVQIRQPSLFHYFRSKQSIMEELLALSLDKTLVDIRRTQQEVGSVGARLHGYLYRDLLDIHSSDFILSGAHGSDFLSEPGFEPWAEKLEELASALRSLVKEGIQSGEFLEMDPLIAQSMIAGVTISHIHLHAIDHVLTPEVMARQGADFMLRGLTGAPVDTEAD